MLRVVRGSIIELSLDDSDRLTSSLPSYIAYVKPEQVVQNLMDAGEIVRKAAETHMRVALTFISSHNRSGDIELNEYSAKHEIETIERNLG